jgi:hypothetical protein
LAGFGAVAAFILAMRFSSSVSFCGSGVGT